MCLSLEHQNPSKTSEKMGYLACSTPLGTFREEENEKRNVPSGVERRRNGCFRRLWVILIALQFRYTLYRPQTKRLRARKIGLRYKILSFTKHLKLVENDK